MAAIAIAKMGLRAKGGIVVGVIFVGIGLSDKYELIRFANFCKFCTGILCNLGIFETEVAAMAAAMAMAKKGLVATLVISS